MIDINITSSSQSYMLTQLGRLIYSTSASTYVTITIGSTIVFAETMMPYNQQIIVYDVYDMVHDYMKGRHLAYTTVTVKAGSTSMTIYVYYEEFTTIGTTSNVYSRFLTSSDTKILCGVPTSEKLFLFGTGTVTINAVGIDDSGNRSYYSTSISATQESNGAYSVTVNFATLDANVTGRLVQVTATCGTRTMTYFFDEGGAYAPHKRIVFYNEYNVLESIDIIGVSTDSAETEMSMVSSSHKKIMYDFSAKRTFKIQSAALYDFQKDSMLALACASSIFVLMDGNLMEAYITESNVEMSDDSGTLNSAEFSYELLDELSARKIMADERSIFNDTYNYVYG